MEQMETNSDDFEQEDPEIFDKDLYKLQNELSCLKIKTQVSKMFLEEQIKYLQELQKSVENNDINLSEDGEMENSLLLMQNTFQKLYEERLKLVSSSESRDNLTSLVQSIESSHHIRENEFEKHLKSFELICEKQENSEELQELNQLQTNLDAETKKLDFLLVEKDQLDKEVTEKEKLDMKELQKIIIELTTFAVKSKKHDEQEEEENMMIKRLENELSMLEAKEKALIDHEEEYLNDNVIQVELCQDKIPHFESIFKDPNDFPYLSSLTKIDDENISSNENKPTVLKEKLVEKISALQDKRSKIKSNEEPQKESNKRVRKSEQSPSGSSKTSDKILKITKQLSPVKKNQITSIHSKSPKKSKATSRKQEVSLIDKLPSKKNRKRSVDETREINNSSPIESGMEKDKKVEVQESPKRSRKRSVFFAFPIDNTTQQVQSPKSKSKPLTMLSPKDSLASPVTIQTPMITSSPRASMDSPLTTKKPMITSTPRVSMDSPLTTKKPMITSSLKASVASPTNKTKVISVEILPHLRFGTEIRSQSNLTDTEPRLVSQEIIDAPIKESCEIKQKSLVTVDNKKTPEVIVESPKEIIWKSPQQKKGNKKQTLIAGQISNISDNCSETSDMENLFNDDFDTGSVTSGTGSEIDFLSPNSTKSFKMDTSENEDAKGSKKTAFDFDSFSDSADFTGGSLF